MMSGTEPQQWSEGAARAVAAVARIRSRRQQGTETLQKSWNDGDLKPDQLPCYDRCNGSIRVELNGETIQGFCPAYMKEGVCPLVTIHEREIASRLTRAGFGVRYHNPDIAKIRVMEPVQEYLAHLDGNLQSGRGMILVGDVGVGKTMVLGYIARQMLEEGVGVWCVHMPEFIEALNNRDTRRDIVDRAIKVQVLMLDDFGSGDMPTWVLGILEGIVENRYGRQRPTWISTNMTREKLTSDPTFRRMVDRWRQTNTLVVIGGESQRLAN